jgi:DNA-binding FadR family transcriptional regulator
MRTTVHQPETDERALAFHRSICAAVRDADPELARHWMEAHLDDLEVTIEQVFRVTPDVKRTGSVPGGVDEAVKGSDNSGS